MVARGCGGGRVPGGVYLTMAATSENGRPFTEFILDPPVPFDAARMGIAARGSFLVTDANGVSHVVDVVGSKHYPNVADYVEESKRLGVSRRISRKFNFDALTPESRLILAHARAWVADPSPFYRYADSRGRVWPCPLNNGAHRALVDEIVSVGGQGSGPPLCCAGFWWFDVDHDGAGSKSDFPFDRQFVSVKYTGTKVNPLQKRSYLLAAFASLPLGPLEVIRDEVDETHEDSARLVGGAAVGFRIVDE